MTFTEQLDMIIQMLVEQRKLLERLLEEKAGVSIEEISLSKAAKLMHKSNGFLVAEVNAGRLKAMTRRDSNGKLRYRFRVSDIYEYQENQSTKTLEYFRNNVEVETPQEIWDRIKRKAEIDAKRNAK